MALSSQAVQQLVSGVVRAGAVPGAAVAMSHAGTRVFATAGAASSTADVPLTPTSRFQLGCITKLLTSLVALEMAAAGRLDLLAPIERYLPELREAAIGASVNATHLLSHTSGYQGLNVADPGVRYYTTWPKFMDALKRGLTLFEPGAVFNYEHTECVLLGEVLKRLSGKSLLELYRTVVFEPLGLECGRIDDADATAATGVAEHGYDPATRLYTRLRSVPYGAFWEGSLSNLTMSLSDLLALCEAIAGIGGPGPFTRTTLDQLKGTRVTLPLSVGGNQHEHTPISFGLGLGQYAPGIYGHNGSARGQTCGLRVDHTAGVALVVALNAWQPYVRDMLSTKILSYFARPSNASATPSSVQRLDFSAFAGHYVGMVGTSIDAREEGAELHCVMRSGPLVPPLHIVASHSDAEKVQITCAATHVTMGFFETSNAPALMVGLNAYRRLAPTPQQDHAPRASL